MSAVPIVGLIESPTSLDKPCTGRLLAVNGWAVHPSGIARVTAQCGQAPAVEGMVGIRRQEVAAAFPDVAGALTAGFLVVVDVSRLAPGAHQALVTAVAGDGTEHRWTVAFEQADPALAYRDWLARNEPPVGAPLQMQRLQFAPSDGPRFSVIIVQGAVADGPAAARTLASLERQNYRDLQGQVCTPGDLPKALAAAEGDFIAIVEAGDTYTDFALGLAAGNLTAQPKTDLLYADHDEWLDGQRMAPHFKPGWSPRLLARHAYIGRCWFARRALLQAAVAPHLGNGGVAHQALLRDIGAQARAVAHLPSVLLTQVAERTAPAAQMAATAPATPAVPAPKTPQARVAATSAVPGPAATPARRPRVSVVIPTRVSDEHILRQCLDGLYGCTEGVELEVIVLPNNVADASAAEAFLRQWPVRVLPWQGRFNWSGINNLGAAEATGDLLLFMNDDVVPLEPGWLKAMVDVALDPAVGAVGAMLYYPNGQLQHGGVWLPWTKGFDGRHAFRFCTGREAGLGDWLAADREQSAVTGACLLSRRECFSAVGGFDEGLALVFNDVDYCLRLRSLGWSSVMAGGARLTHHEGVSRVGMSEAADARLFMDRWEGYLPEVDPYSNPNLDPRRDDWALRPDASSPWKAREVLTPATRMLYPWTQHA